MAFQTGFSEEFHYEYGIDACRIARISPGSSSDEKAGLLLEPSFKWLARLHQQVEMAGKDFVPDPWLEAAIQSRDHILNRENASAALATVRHAAKVSPPHAGLNANAFALVFACLYPFAPILAMYGAQQTKARIENLPALIGSFENHVCIRFALENGGWHQKVFDRKKFAANPLSELRNVKWIEKALGDRCATIAETEEGLKICIR